MLGDGLVHTARDMFLWVFVGRVDSSGMPCCLQRFQGKKLEWGQLVSVMMLMLMLVLMWTLFKDHLTLDVVMRSCNNMGVRLA